MNGKPAPDFTRTIADGRPSLVRTYLNEHPINFEADIQRLLAGKPR